MPVARSVSCPGHLLRKSSAFARGFISSPVMLVRSRGRLVFVAFAPRALVLAGLVALRVRAAHFVVVRALLRLAAQLIFLSAAPRGVRILHRVCVHLVRRIRRASRRAHRTVVRLLIVRLLVASRLIVRHPFVVCHRRLSSFKVEDAAAFSDSRQLA